MAQGNGRVSSGQRLNKAISARAWNRAQDAADIVLSRRLGMDGESSFTTARAVNLVYVKNTSDTAVPRFGVLGIGTSEGMALSPNSGDYGDFLVFNGATPDEGHRELSRFVVAMEPIPVNGIGRAAVSGCFECRVDILDPAHHYATAVVGNVTKLESTDCGALQILVQESGPGQPRTCIGVM